MVHQILSRFTFKFTLVLFSAVLNRSLVIQGQLEEVPEIICTTREVGRETCDICSNSILVLLYIEVKYIFCKSKTSQRQNVGI